MSERNPRVIRSQMGDLASEPDRSEPESRLEAEKIERREGEQRQDRAGGADTANDGG